MILTVPGAYCAENPLAAASTPTAKAGTEAAGWDQVDTLIKEIRHPKEAPKTQEEVIQFFRKKIPELNRAYQSAITNAPQDPRRWNAALFLRQFLGDKAHFGSSSSGVPIPTLEEISQTPDAPPEVKAESSYLLLMKSSPENTTAANETSAWITKADQYVKEHPGSRFAQMVQDKISSLKTLAELKTKPVDLKFTALDGREVDLEKLRGKVVLIDFWATWCGPCRAEIPEVMKTYQKLHDQGFEVVGISLDNNKAKLESFVKEKGMPWPQYFDEKDGGNAISTKFGIESIPTMWLVNKQGMLSSTDSRGDLENQVTKLLAEQPPKNP